MSTSFGGSLSLGTFIYSRLEGKIPWGEVDLLYYACRLPSSLTIMAVQNKRVGACDGGG